MRYMSAQRVLAAVIAHLGEEAAEAVRPIRRDSGAYSLNKNRAVSRLRQIAVWCVRELSNESYTEIAREMGMRHHTSVLHAYRRAIANIPADELRATADAVRSTICANATDRPPIPAQRE